MLLTVHHLCFWLGQLLGHSPVQVFTGITFIYEVSGMFCQQVLVYTKSQQQEAGNGCNLKNSPFLSVPLCVDTLLLFKHNRTKKYTLK